MNPTQPKYTVGTTFKTRGKCPRTCTVVDVWTTYNLVGEVVKQVYIATYEFCGQIVTCRDICETTISMGLTNTEA